MTDSLEVLGLMKVVYVAYVAIVFSLMAAFAIAITRKHRVKPRFRVPFYGWIGLLVCVGVGIHLLTFNKIPWVKWDKNGDDIRADREFNISIDDYEFILPAKTLVAHTGEMVRFNLESADYTYGFGLFREDGSMALQMQVVPGHENSMVWQFHEPGVYSIRSTEYSGPRGSALHLPEAFVVAEAPSSDVRVSEND